MDKKISRQRRAAKTRVRIARQEAVRLTVHRTNQHIYAQVIDANGGKVLASASTLEKDVRASHPKGGGKEAAADHGRPSIGRTAPSFHLHGGFAKSRPVLYRRVKPVPEQTLSSRV